MPSGDRTGPLGEGPRTGRGFGDCDEQGVFARPRRRVVRGFGFRAELGRGFTGQRVRRGFREPVYEYAEDYPVEGSELTKEDEKKVLKKELLEIESEKQEIERKLKELE